MIFWSCSCSYTFCVLIGLPKSIFHKNNLLCPLVFVRRRLVFVIIGLVLLELFVKALKELEEAYA